MIQLRQFGMKIANSFPIDLYLISDATIIMSPVFGINIPSQAVYDYHPEGISGMFDKEGFSLFEKSIDDKQDYVYNTTYAYKEMPVLRAWLMQQNLVLPQGIE